MIYLQVVVIFFIILLLINIFKGDFLEPSLLACYVYLISTIAAVIGKNMWEIEDINFISFVVTILFLLSVVLGNLLARKIRPPAFCLHGKQTTSYSGILKINTALLLFLVAIAVYTLYRNFIAVYQLSIQQGNPYGLAAMLKYYRIALRNGYSLNLGFLLTQSIQLIGFLSSVFFYVIINNYIYNKESPLKNWLMLVYIAIAWAIYALTSSRGGYINILSSYLILFFCSLLKKTGWRYKKIRGKALTFAIIAFSILMIIFSALGNNTGKTAQAGGAFNQAIKYLGGSIYSFGEYVDTNGLAGGNGQIESLSGLNKLLSYIGLQIQNVSEINLEAVTVGNMSTNVYTAARRYINDFSIIGCLIIGLIIGFFYGEFYKHVKSDKNAYSFSLLLYSQWVYPLFYLSFDDMFLRGMISAGTVYDIVYFTIIWYVLSRVLKKQERVCNGSGFECRLS